MTAAQFARPQADAYLLVYARASSCGSHFYLYHLACTNRRRVVSGMGVGSAPKSLQTAGKTVDVVEVQQPAGNELGLSMMLTFFFAVVACADLAGRG